MIVVIWGIFAIVAGIIAAKKNRSVVGWVLLAIILTPLTILILLALEPLPTAPATNVGASRTESDSWEPVRTETVLPPPQRSTSFACNGKVCPACAETVRAEAKICRFCRYEFTVEEFKNSQEAEVEWRRDRLQEIVYFLTRMPRNGDVTLATDSISEICTLVPDIDKVTRQRRYELKTKSDTKFLYSDWELGTAIGNLPQSESGLGVN